MSSRPSFSDDDEYFSHPEKVLSRHSYAPNQRPLIDLVTNEWRNNRRGSDSSDSSFASDDSILFSCTSDSEGWPPRLPRWAHTVKPPVIPRKLQRCLVLLVVFVILAWMWFERSVKPGWDEERMFGKAFQAAMNAQRNEAARFGASGVYGAHREIEFDGIIKVKNLAKEHLPRSGKHENRLVIVGDVHGCKVELTKLLDKVEYDRKRDHLILTGDMINKGPDTPGVVDLLRDLGASCVRGNHEDLVLLVWRDLHSRSSLSPLSAEQDEIERSRYSKSEYRARKTARELSVKQVRWLQECPVILNVGEVEGIGEVNVVHAGLVPGVSLKRQDPFQVMNMRSMDPTTRVPSENREGERWDKMWSYWQKKLPKEERSTVVYGHDSKRGLNIGHWVKGLDSGCVNGGELTALAIGGKGEQSVVSVKCYSQRVDSNAA